MADARRRLLALSLVAVLAACGGSAPEPGAETVGEIRALDDAAEMLKLQRTPSPAAQASDPGAIPSGPPTS